MERRILAVLLDFGDTLSDQATERDDESGFMYDVDLLDGARELLVALKQRGYAVGLVATAAPTRTSCCASATSSTS